jgi:hypothetical protein
MKLLPGQRRFIEAVYGRVAPDGRRQNPHCDQERA